MKTIWISLPTNAAFVTLDGNTAYTGNESEYNVKPIACDLPYPMLDNLVADVRTGQILSFAYATVNGELTAVLQYAYQNFLLQTADEQTAEILMGISMTEMHHFKLLGTTMYKLGVTPTITQRPGGNVPYNSGCVSQSTNIQKMLMDDLKSELNAIAEYKKMLMVMRNEQVEALVERIILDEQLHVETLKQLMTSAKSN